MKANVCVRETERESMCKYVRLPCQCFQLFIPILVCNHTRYLYLGLKDKTF